MLELMKALHAKIGPIDGHYLRPFVADGNPSICPIVLLGYNPATPIPEVAIDPDEYCRLLFSRGEFERFYSQLRAERKIAQGKKNFKPLSDTRRRLGIIRNVFSDFPIAEMNTNAWATRDLAELKKTAPSTVIAGRRAASWAATIVNPELVIAYGNDIRIPDTLGTICKFSLLGQATRIHEFVQFYDAASWNGKPAKVAHITIHLVARRKGITDERFSEIAKTIRARFELLRPRPPDFAQHVTSSCGVAHNQEAQQMSTLKNPWNDFFLRHFATFGDGTQISRDSYRLRNDPKPRRRLFKVEPPDQPKVISLMTKNFNVDPYALSKRLQEDCFKTTIKPKYVEVEVQSQEQAHQSLNVFLAMLSPDLRIQI